MLDNDYPMCLPGQFVLGSDSSLCSPSLIYTINQTVLTIDSPLCTLLHLMSFCSGCTFIAESTQLLDK